MHRIIGIENELIVSGKGVESYHKFGHMVSDIAELTEKPFYSFSTHNGSGYMLWNGSLMYSDGGAAEVTSAAAEIKPGCVTECIDSLFTARNMLFDALGKYNEKNNTKIILGAYSGHYNISIGENDYEKMFDMIKEGIGVACMLLIEKKNSKGVMVRDKNRDRIEFCGEYIPSYEQNIAAMAFMLGAVNAMMKGEIKLPFKVKIRKTKQGGSDVIWPNTYAANFLKKARDANVTVSFGRRKTQKMKAQKVLEEYFAFFKDDIQKIAPAEINILEDYVKGNRQLIIDKAGIPEHYKPASKSKDVDMQPKGIAQYFARAVNGREEFRGYELKTLQISWDDIFFCFKGNKSRYTQHSKVDRSMLARFYSDIDEAKTEQGTKKLDELVKNIRNNVYSGSPQPDYYFGRKMDE